MDYISMDSSADFIEHFGIKGMKWGVRSRHAGLSDSYHQYKLAKNKNRSDRNGGSFGKHDYLHDKAVRSLARKNMAKHKYKAERDAALLKEKPGSEKLKNRMNMHKQKSKDYEQVFNKYQSHMHDDKNHKGHDYKDVDKRNLSGTEKRLNNKVANRGKIHNAAQAAAATAAVAGLLAAPAAPEIARYLRNGKR